MQDINIFSPNQVVALLEKSPVWAQYRDQKHDLFLDSAPVAGYLTAGTPGVAGFLTQGNARVMSSTPPSVNNTRRQPELP